MGGSYGTPRKEARFVLDQLSIKINPPGKYEKIILVDASDLSKGIHKKLDLNSVMEIIDHRKVTALEKFPNVKKSQIELVGACATLIAEKFYENKLEPSKNSAVLLYSAIIWNTINLRNNVTTERDVRMATWLLTKINLPRDFIYEMFAYGQEDCLKELYFVNLEFNGKKVGIAQIETVNLDEFISKNKEEIITILNSNKNNFDYIFITCIDLDRGINRFICIDENIMNIIEKLFEVKFKDMVAEREGIIMRKEIIPILKEYLFK